MAKKPTVYEFIPKLGQLRDDVLFGDVWEHKDPSKRDRSLATVAFLAALYRTDEMRPHEARTGERRDRNRAEGLDHPRCVLRGLALRGECGADRDRRVR